MNRSPYWSKFTWGQQRYIADYTLFLHRSSQNHVQLQSIMYRIHISISCRICISTWSANLCLRVFTVWRNVAWPLDYLVFSSFLFHLIQVATKTTKPSYVSEIWVILVCFGWGRGSNQFIILWFPDLMVIFGNCMKATDVSRVWMNDYFQAMFSVMFRTETELR